MAIFSNKIVEAKFLDIDNTIIEVLYKDGESLISHAFEVDFDNPDFQDLMEEHTLEDIEKYTHDKRKLAVEKQQRKLEEEVSNRIKDQVKSDTPMTVENLFSELVNKRKDMSFLFQFKVYIFKNKDVIDSKDKDVKKKIRKSQDLFEIMELMKQIM